MLTGFVMFLHAVVCIVLVTVILMQSGRGGGLTEGLAGAESMFGAQTNEFMIKATTIFATVFLVTCLGLAVLSARRSESLMSNKVAAPVPKAAQPAGVDEPVPVEQTAEETQP